MFRQFLLRTGVLCLMAGLLGGGLFSPLPAQGQAQRFVYVSLSKNLYSIDGATQVLDVYRCPSPCDYLAMEVLDSKFTFQVDRNDCDECLPCGGNLSLAGPITLRLPGPANPEFGLHMWQFQWRDDCGNTILGTMEGTVASGTHRPPGTDACEPCRVPYHFEGLMKGRIVAGPLFDKYGPLSCVQATYAGTFFGQWPTISFVQLSLDGVYCLPCLQQFGPQGNRSKPSGRVSVNTSSRRKSHRPGRTLARRVASR